MIGSKFRFVCLFICRGLNDSQRLLANSPLGLLQKCSPTISRRWQADPVLGEHEDWREHRRAWTQRPSRVQWQGRVCHQGLMLKTFLGPT